MSHEGYMSHKGYMSFSSRRFSKRKIAGMIDVKKYSMIYKSIF